MRRQHAFAVQRGKQVCILRQQRKRIRIQHGATPRSQGRTDPSCLSRAGPHTRTQTQRIDSRILQRRA